MTVTNGIVRRIAVAAVEPGTTSSNKLTSHRGTAVKVIEIFKAGSFARYVLVGITNTVAGVAAFAFLYWAFGEIIDVNYLLVANWIINNLLSFVLHKLMTFEASGSPYKQMPKFFALSFLSLATHVCVINVVRHFFDINPVFVVLFTNFLLAGVFMIINYVGMRHFVFNKDKP